MQKQKYKINLVRGKRTKFLLPSLRKDKGGGDQWIAGRSKKHLLEQPKGSRLCTGEKFCTCWTLEIDGKTEISAWAKGELGSFTRYWIHLISGGEAGTVTVMWQWKNPWMVCKQSGPNGILCKSRKLKRIFSQQHCCLNVEIICTAIFIHQNAAWKQSYLSGAQVSIEKVSVYFPFSFLVCVFWMWRWQ